MNPTLIVTLEITLVLGCVLGFAGWELWRLRRDRRSTPDEIATVPSADESPS